MTILNELSSCEVCDNQDIKTVLNLGMHPLCDDLISAGENRICEEYPIEIVFCDQCFTAHQRYQVPKKDLFPKTYHYRSRFTADVLNGMSSLVDACEEKVSLKGKLILDVGCNDGSLLDFFHSKGAKTIGIEPTDAYRDAKEVHHIYNSFLSRETSDLILKEFGQPDVITFTNVFAHIENLSEVLANIKLLMSPTTLLVIENHYLGSVLDYNQFDTFYHEHPRTYSYHSFIKIANTLNANLSDVQFPSRYGGNIRVFIGLLDNRTDKDKIQKVIAKEKHFLEQFEQMNSNITKWVDNKKQIIEKLNLAHGKIVAKAFPGRAAILIKMLGINEDQVACAFEKPGSMKIGYYIPGTRILIKSDNDLFKLDKQPDVILNLAWHIFDEINSYLKENSVNSKVINILDSEDFNDC